jgi:hypothetical protein
LDVPDGKYTISIALVDASSNRVQQNIPFTVDNTAPQIRRDIIEQTKAYK